MKYFEVVSGMPGGEVYHRDVVIAFSVDTATRRVAWWNEQIKAGVGPARGKWEGEKWLWGPQFFERDGDPALTRKWDGREEVPAQVI